MMGLCRKTLFVALAVVWITVLINDDFPLAVLNRSADYHAAPSEQKVRLRQAIREKYHRVVDKHPSPSQSSQTHRVREAVRDKIRRVKDKIRKPKGSKISQYEYSPPQPNSNQGYPYSPQAYNDAPVAGKQNTRKSSSILSKLAKKIFKHKGAKYGVAAGAGGAGIYAASNNNNNHHDYQQGTYNNYNYRPDGYGAVRGAECTNYLEYNGIVYGKFMCPVEGFDLSATYCCGPPREQYCCSGHESQQDQYNQRRGLNSNNNMQNNYEPYQRERSGGSSFTILILLLILVPLCVCALIGCAICVFCAYKKRAYLVPDEPEVPDQDEKENADSESDYQSSSG